MHFGEITKKLTMNFLINFVVILFKKRRSMEAFTSLGLDLKAKLNQLLP
jgi:hypothetical protein